MARMPMRRPRNVLLITSDQHHHSALGVETPVLRTPALDRLAREGTRFTRAYCANPTCTPARSTMLTGLYPSMHGAWTLGTKLPEDVPTINDRLRPAGFATSLIGKAHFQPLDTTPTQTSIETYETLRDLEFWRDFRGPWYGFETAELARQHADEYMAGSHYGLWLEERGLRSWRDHFSPSSWVATGRRGAWDLPEELHYSVWTAERTIAAIERAVEAGRPFFTWASFQDPHPPYLVPEPWASMYDPADMEPGRLVPGELDRMPPHHRLTQEPHPDFSAWDDPASSHSTHGFVSHVPAQATLAEDMATYYGMISLMDREIGRILDALDRLGLADDTLVIFTTDHGHFLGQHGLTEKGPFHYEDMLRIPFLVRAPGHVPAGTVQDALIGQVDIAPTILDAVGLPVPGLMQGASYWRALTEGAAPPRDHVIVENRHQPSTVHLRTYVERDHKLTVYRGRPYGELFDLAADPDELHNLWDEPSAAGLKADLMARFLDAELRREPTRNRRIAGA